MEVRVINTYQEIRNYIARVKNGDSPTLCWEEEVISVYWDQLCCYAPFDLSERKPLVITDIATLELQCDLLEQLGVLGIDSILLEGGGELNEAFLRHGLVDEVCAFIAPKLIGGSEAKTPIEGQGFAMINDAVVLDDTSIERVGTDILICGIVKRQVKE
jgi:riboflavin biosynthesis pyrimidine reductase